LNPWGLKIFNTSAGKTTSKMVSSALMSDKFAKDFKFGREIIQKGPALRLKMSKNANSFRK